MTTYKLKRDGDYWERRFWHYLEDTFPNYEVFWARFIAGPLSRREIDGNIAIRGNLDPLLEELAMAHYSVFYHLAMAHWLLEVTQGIQRSLGRREPALYEAVFFYTSAATEMIEHFAFTIWKIAVRLGKCEGISELAIDEVVRMARETAESSYRNGFNKFRETGKSVNIRLHSVRNCLSYLVPLLPKAWEGAWKQFTILADQKIRHYRNVLTHNPVLGKILQGDDMLVPKPNKLRRYRLWSSLFYRRETDDLTSIAGLLDRYLAELEQAANRLWEFLVPLMSQLSEEPTYENMFNMPTTFTVTTSAALSGEMGSAGFGDVDVLPSGVHLDGLVSPWLDWLCSEGTEGLPSEVDSDALRPGRLSDLDLDGPHPGPHNLDAEEE